MFRMFFNRLKSFYDKNQFYSWLIGLTGLGIIYFTFFYLYRKTPEYSNIGKSWEIASYLLTFIYTGYIWFGKRGKIIFEKIIKEEKVNTIVFVLISMFIVFIITIFHLIAPFLLGDLDKIIKEIFNIEIDSKAFSGAINMMLLTIVYFIFCNIDRKIINNHPTHKIKRDFIIGYKNSDKPTLIAFGLFFLYAVLVTLIPNVNYGKMELFFSGAIAFELIMSSIIWAITETI